MDRRPARRPGRSRRGARRGGDAHAERRGPRSGEPRGGRASALPEGQAAGGRRREGGAENRSAGAPLEGMKMNDVEELTSEELLVLAVLLRLMIRLDGRFSDAQR